MRLVPDDNGGKIQFFETHLTPWTENAEEIGTNAETVAMLESQTQAARDAYTAQQQAMQAAQTATLRLQNTINAMASTGSSIIMQIRAKATQSNAADNVYELAMIPAPASASKIAPPGQPTSFTMNLQQIGWLTIQWKCKNPRGAVGTMYQVRRRIGNGPSEFLGMVGEKKFEDRTVPMGTSAITYEVQAVRSTSVGPVATYNVTFGGRAMPAAMMTRAA